jgi:hypothetical protein
LWLDTTGYLAPARLATFASRSVRLQNHPMPLPPLPPPFSLALTRENVQPAHKRILTRLNIAPTFDTATARRTIETLDAQAGDASGTPESRANRFRIVVLDTVTALLGPQLSGVSSQGNVNRDRTPHLLQSPLPPNSFVPFEPPSNDVCQLTTTTDMASLLRLQDMLK